MLELVGDPSVAGGCDCANPEPIADSAESSCIASASSTLDEVTVDRRNPRNDDRPHPARPLRCHPRRPGPARLRAVPSGCESWTTERSTSSPIVRTGAAPSRSSCPSSPRITVRLQGPSRISKRVSSTSSANGLADAPPVGTAWSAATRSTSHWPGTKLIVELDSWAYHQSKSSFHGDRAKWLDLRAQGFDVHDGHGPDAGPRSGRIADAIRELSRGE